MIRLSRLHAGRQHNAKFSRASWVGTQLAGHMQQEEDEKMILDVDTKLGYCITHSQPYPTGRSGSEG
jgi:hypothetical protein